MFIVYYKQGCPYSKNAENLLSLYKLSFIKIIIDDYSIIRKLLLQKPYYHPTMPAIFYYKNELFECQKLSCLLISTYMKSTMFMKKKERAYLHV